MVMITALQGDTQQLLPGTWCVQYARVFFSLLLSKCLVCIRFLCLKIEAAGSVRKLLKDRFVLQPGPHAAAPAENTVICPPQ